MDLMNLLKDQLGNQNVLQKLGQSVGADAGQVSKLTELGLPAILEGLTRNAQTNDGAASLAKALDQHQDDDVDDLEGFLGKVDTDDGAKILNHVFADKNSRVTGNLAKKTGLDAGQVMGVLSQLAPVVLGALGKQKKEQNLDASGIAGLLPGLGGLLGGGGGKSGIAGLLDSDGDGDIMDDVQGLLGKFMK